MRRYLSLATVASLALVIALVGCAKKDDQAAAPNADSLLSASPVEPSSGDITPQTDYQQPPAATNNPPAQTSTRPRTSPRPSGGSAPVATNPGVTIPAGTPIKVTVNAQISSETAQAGDAWQGVVADPVVIGTAAPIPAGSIVHGVVRGVAPAQKGSRAYLLLSVTSIDVNGKTHNIGAGTDSIVAGSTRARNLGAIAGGAAAGALIGKAVGGGGKGALIGGLIGAGATTAGVAGSKGYQVVLKEGTEMTFTTRETEHIKE